MSDAIEQAALRLREAGEKRQPNTPIRDLIAPTDVASAYAVQCVIDAAYNSAEQRGAPIQVKATV